MDGTTDDAVILGGEPVEPCLTLQLRDAFPGMAIVVPEPRRPHPLPKAAPKVGESTADIGAHDLATWGLRCTSTWKARTSTRSASEKNSIAVASASSGAPRCMVGKFGRLGEPHNGPELPTARRRHGRLATLAAGGRFFSPSQPMPPLTPITWPLM